MKARPWQLASNSLRYSSEWRQTSQNPNSARKTCQHDVDKFMKLDELGKSAKLVGKTCQHYVTNPSK